MDIYNSEGELLLSITPDDSSYEYKAMQESAQLILYFSAAEHTEIPVGSYVIFNDTTYTLMRPEALTMHHTRNFEYTVTFEGAEYYAKLWKLRNTVDMRLKFSYTAKALEHLQLFVDNMNRRDSGWTIGECFSVNSEGEDTSAETLISYDHATCWEALEMMADTFETEFEIVGKTVSLHKVEYNKSAPLAMSYGKGNGFKPDVGRSNYGDTPPTEILFAQGGETNIDYSKYGSQYLLLPKSGEIAFDGTYFEDEEGFDEDAARTYITDDKGYSVWRKDRDFSVYAEESLDCSDIYPQRVGTVSAIECEDEDNHLWNFYDEDIPDDLDYGDCLIDGEAMTVIFQSGMLAGKEFECSYVHSKRKFELVAQEIDGITMPDSDTGYVPAVNDTYAVFGVYLPDAYINAYDETDGEPVKEGAEWDMLREAVRYLYENEDIKFTFTGEMDGVWSKADWTNVGAKILLGGYISFTDERWQEEAALVRIIGIKTYLNKPYSPELELSNSTITASFSTQLKQIESTAVQIEDTKKAAIAYTKRRWRDVSETQTMLAAALLKEFTEAITPITVQTMQLIAGSEQLQFYFVESASSETIVDDGITWDDDTATLTCPDGYIRHYTLGITDLTSSHDVSDYMVWEMGAETTFNSLDSDTAYYLYLKAMKSSQSAYFYISGTAYELENDTDADAYWLLVGILNSEYDGTRSFVTVYGYTEITPGRVTAQKVVSVDGNSYFDMANNAFKLSDKLQYNVDGDGVLRLKGTIVQSQGEEDESYIGCYRGVYSSAYTYYNGDMVVYTYNGLTSLYRCITTEEGGITGIAPTNTTYWAVLAQGSKGSDGEDGTSISVEGACVGYEENVSSFAENEAANYISAVGNIVLIGDMSDYSDVVGGLASGFSGACYAKLTSQTTTEGSPFVATWNFYAADEGDCYVSSSDGHLWIAGSDTWEDCGVITGADGDYTELRYQVNGSPTAAPSVDNSEREPDGWTASVPSVGSLEYLWMIQATINGVSDELESEWSTPVRVTAVDGVDGADGIDGLTITINPSAVVHKYEEAEELTFEITIKEGTETLPWYRSTNSAAGHIECTACAVPDEMSLSFNYSNGDEAGSFELLDSVTGTNKDFDASGVVELTLAIYRLDGTQTEHTLTIPVKTVKDGEDGEDGADGVSPAAVYRGVWSSGETYYGNSYRVDVVKYGDAYYVARVDAGTINDSTILPTNTDYWNSFGASFDSVATQLLAAELANIAGFIFRNSRLESETLADGSTTTGTTTETPMLFLNGTTGEVSFGGGKFAVDSGGNATMQDVTMQDVTATNGTFSGVINATGGIQLPVVVLSADTVLDASACVVVLQVQEDDITVTMPSSPNDGQSIIFVNNNVSEGACMMLKVASGSGQYFSRGTSGSGQYDITTAASQYSCVKIYNTMQYVYDASNKMWWLVSRTIGTS